MAIPWGRRGLVFTVQVSVALPRTEGGDANPVAQIAEAHRRLKRRLRPGGELGVNGVQVTAIQDLRNGGTRWVPEEEGQ